MALWILFTSLAPFSPVLTLCYSNCQALCASLGRLKCVWETREKDLFAIHVNDLHLALKGRNVPDRAFKQGYPYVSEFCIKTIQQKPEMQKHEKLCLKWA